MSSLFFATREAKQKAQWPGSAGKQGQVIDTFAAAIIWITNRQLPPFSMRVLVCHSSIFFDWTLMLTAQQRGEACIGWHGAG
jgi:hypothetical protein